MGRECSQEPLLTLGSVSAGAILHQDVVEGLVGAVGEAVHVHVPDPLVAHHAGRIPAVNHTVVAIPESRNCTQRLWKLQSQLFFLKINRAQTGQEPPDSWHNEERNRRTKKSNSERLCVCILRWREMTMNDWINRLE